MKLEGSTGDFTVTGGGGSCQRRGQIFAMGARSPEGTLTSQGPLNFNFLLGFRPHHFANMIKTFFVKFCIKNFNIQTEGPLTSQGTPISIFLSDFGHFILQL